MRRVAPYLWLLLPLFALPFVFYAVQFGVAGLRQPPFEDTYLYRRDHPGATTAIAAHMVAGGVLTLLVVLQLIAPLRRRCPAVHRWMGRALVTLAGATAVGGLVYIAARGTIGGWPMDIGFAAYGLALAATGGLAWRAARARDWGRHRLWALRFFVLAMGSWLYRVFYGLWYLATDGLASNAAFTGAFDITMVFAFYLLPLGILELTQRHR